MYEILFFCGFYFLKTLKKTEPNSITKPHTAQHTQTALYAAELRANRQEDDTIVLFV